MYCAPALTARHAPFGNRSFFLQKQSAEVGARLRGNSDPSRAQLFNFGVGLSFEMAAHLYSSILAGMLALKRPPMRRSCSARQLQQLSMRMPYV